MAKYDTTAPLVPSGHYEYSNRPYRDRAWGVAYVLVLALAVAGGVYGYSNRNPLYEKTTHVGYLNDPKHCPIPHNQLDTPRRIALQDTEADFDLAQFFRQGLTWLLVCALCSIVIGYAYLLLFRRHAVFMVKATAVLQVLLPLSMAVAAAMVTNSMAAAAPFLFVAGMAALAMYLWRDFFGLCGRLLSVATEGLTANTGIFGIVLVQQLLVLCVSLPLIAGMGISWTNGDVVPNPARSGRAGCYGDDGEEVVCCVWQPDTWVLPYLGITALGLVWSSFLAFAIRLFVIAGTVAQWYFAPTTLGRARSPPGSLGRAVGQAFGPSFGSLCLGSGVLTWVELMRQASHANDDNANQQSLLMTCLRSVMECINQLIEYLTKFAIVRMAITGEAFFSAGRAATDLLARNFLKSFGVWWFPPLVLNTTAAIVSLVWGGAVFGASYFFWHNTRQGMADAVVLAVLSGLIMLGVLGFFFGVLLNVVDVTYFCYAMDLDAGTRSRQEVHVVFAQVPGINTQGTAVQNPDGNIMYGAPYAGAPYAPPPVHHYPGVV